MMDFQKQMTMPANIFSTRGDEKKLFDDIDLKIDEHVEDMESSDASVSDSDLMSKKPSIKPKRNVVSDKKWGAKKDKKMNFFVHNAKSFKKQKKIVSMNTTVSVTHKVASTKQKIKMIKMNSVAFKDISTKKMGGSRSPSPYKGTLSPSVSQDSSNEDQGSPDINDFDNAIISPIRWAEVTKQGKVFRVLALSLYRKNRDQGWRVLPIWEWEWEETPEQGFVKAGE